MCLLYTFNVVFVFLVLSSGVISEVISDKFEQNTPQRTESSKRLVIIDTDAGVDDALALMVAFDYHKRGLIEILGITCSYGNTYVDNVIKNVLLTRRVSATEDVKVYRGAVTPILNKVGLESDYFGVDGLGNASFSLPQIDIKIEREHAVLAMTRLVRQYPKQISLITLAPMTNLAMAIQLDPTFTKNLAQIVSMGGLLDPLGNMGPTTEFNFLSDPESVAIVLKKSECPLSFVPLDAILSYALTKQQIEQIKNFNTSKAQFIEKITEMNVQMNEGSYDGIPFCDAMCVIAAVIPELVLQRVEYPTAMELAGSLTRGQLVVGRTETTPTFYGSRNVTFAVKFDYQKTIDLITKIAEK